MISLLVDPSIPLSRGDVRMLLAAIKRGWQPPDRETRDQLDDKLRVALRSLPDRTKIAARECLAAMQLQARPFQNHVI